MQEYYGLTSCIVAYRELAAHHMLKSAVTLSKGWFEVGRVGVGVGALVD